MIHQTLLGVLQAQEGHPRKESGIKGSPSVQRDYGGKLGSVAIEMKLVMIRIIPTAMVAHPTVTTSCFVDDLSAEMTGPDDHIEIELGGFIMNVANSFTEEKLELSKTKCVCSASSITLGKLLEAKWKELNIEFDTGVKSLGGGLGSGWFRNTQVM